ncbi:response regulator [Azospirillum sp. sgz301742]
MITVTLIEDDALVRAGTEAFLRAAGYLVISGATGDDLVWKITESGIRPDVLLCDYRLGTATALDAVPEAMDVIKAKVPVIILTGDSSPEVREAIQVRGWHRMLKPYTPNELLFMLSQIETRVA